MALKPAYAINLLGHQTFDLGHRVIYVMDTGNVPWSAKGTVVGVEGSIVDVLFDQTFIGGQDLGLR